MSTPIVYMVANPTDFLYNFQVGGAPVDLTTATLVQLLLKRQNASAAIVLPGAVNGTPTAGNVECLGVTSVNMSGIWQAQFRVTFASGAVINGVPSVQLPFVANLDGT